MTISVKLNPQEKIVAATCELSDFAATLGVDKELAKGSITGDMYGSIMALAKAFNLYPHLGGSLPFAPLVSHRHMPMQVVWAKEPQSNYPVRRVQGMYLFVVTGTNPDYIIHGYVPSGSVQVTKDGGTIYHHVLHEVANAWVFAELLDESRQPKGDQ